MYELNCVCENKHKLFFTLKKKVKFSFFLIVLNLYGACREL
jgi:hypothetical protein